MAIIDEILETARIESGRVEVRAGVFDLRQVCEEVAGLFRLSAAEKGLTLTLDLGTDLPASLARVDGVWVDALRVAVAEGSPAHIKALVDQLDQGELRRWLTKKVGRYDLEAIRGLLGSTGGT